MQILQNVLALILSLLIIYSINDVIKNSKKKLDKEKLMKQLKRRKT